jgi:hypothetical protein
MILLELQGPFTEFIALERERAIKQNIKGRRATDEEAAQNAILKDTLTAEDWDILSQYKDLLEPCLEATNDLQGRLGDSKSYGLSGFSQTLNVSSYTLPLPMNAMSQLRPRQSKDNGILLLKSNWRLIKLRSTMLSSMT